jgi:hypothetical protein
MGYPGYPGMGYPGMGVYGAPPPMATGPSIYTGSFAGSYPSSIGGYGTVGAVGFGTVGGYGTVGAVGGSQYVGSVYGANSLNQATPFGSFGGLSMGPSFVGRQYVGSIYGGGAYPGYPGMGYPGMGYPGMGYPGMGYPGMGYYPGYGYGSSMYQPPCSCDSGCAGRDNNVCCEDVDQC